MRPSRALPAQQGGSCSSCHPRPPSPRARCPQTSPLCAPLAAAVVCTFTCICVRGSQLPGQQCMHVGARRIPDKFMYSFGLQAATVIVGVSAMLQRYSLVEHLPSMSSEHIVGTLGMIPVSVKSFGHSCGAAKAYRAVLTFQVWGVEYLVRGKDISFQLGAPCMSDCSDMHAYAGVPNRQPDHAGRRHAHGDGRLHRDRPDSGRAR